MLTIKRFGILQYLAAFGLVGILTACGGGGGDDGVYFDPNVAPANVQVVAGDDSITEVQNTISWNKVTAATDYRVYWSDSPGVTTSDSVVSTVSSTFNYMTHNVGLVPGQTYYYKVQALSGATGSVLSAEAKGTPQQAITGENLHDVAWNGTDTLVAVGDSGYIINSSNGTVDGWFLATDNPVAGSGTTMSGVTWDGGQFLAVGSGGTILTSADGDNWTLQMTDPVSLEGIVWTGNHYIVAGGSGNIFISSDASVWTPASVPANVANDTFNAVASNKSVLLADRVAVAVGTNGVILSSNDDGASWVDRSAVGECQCKPE